MKSEVECSKCFCDSLFHQLGKLDVSGEEKIEISNELHTIFLLVLLIAF